MLRQRREMDHPAEGEKDRERERECRSRDEHANGNGWSSIHPALKYSLVPSNTGNIRNMLK